MTASNQIFLVMDAGHHRGCIHDEARGESLPATPVRRIHQPAGLYVLGQSRLVHHDLVGGAGGVKHT
jgi:hypothetical protein